MQLLVNGVLFGSLLALAAVGLALIFGVMGVVNLAHGEFLTAGAFFGFFALGSWNWNLWVALVLVLAAGGLVGYVLQIVLLRKVVGESPLRSLLLTFGLSMVLLGGLSAAFSGNVRSYEAPLSGSLSALGVRVPVESAVIAAIAVVLFLCLVAMLFWTKTGVGLRATAQHREAAASCGVNLARIDAIALAMSIALVGAAGLLLSMRYAIRPEFGVPWLLQSIIVIILGGMGSIFGAMAGGIVIGVAFTVLSYFFGSVVGQLVLYSGIFLLLLARPYGFAGSRP